MGKTKRGKGTKLMAVADGSGLPISVHAAEASPHEVTLVKETLEASFVEAKPERLIGDRAYDSEPLDAELRGEGIEMIAPHRRGRKKLKTQDGRKLRRYKRRWKVERLFAWLGNFRRLPGGALRAAAGELSRIRTARLRGDPTQGHRRRPKRAGVRSV